MGEIFRLQQIEASLEGEVPLRDCSIHIEDGELLVVAGERDSGRRTLFEVLTGRLEIRKGKIYHREERIRTGRLPEECILRLEARRRMTQGLTILENMKCMSSGKQECGRRSVAALLREMGLEGSPDRITGSCSEQEQLLLWFALAAVREIPVVCLNLEDFSLGGEDMVRILKASEVCRRRGTAVVIFTGDRDPLCEAADRTAWMKGGAVARVFQGAEEWRKLFPSLPDEEPAGYCFRSGNICFLIDPGWPMGCTLPDYLRRNPRREWSAVTGDIPAPDQRRCFYVPEDSHLHLMENEPIGKNLILTLSGRLGTRFGFIQKDMERFLEQEFCRRFRVPEHTETVMELPVSLKKILSLYRVLMLRPDTALLEEPLLPFDEEDKPAAAELIREMAEQGIGLVISGKDPGILRYFPGINADQAAY